MKKEVRIATISIFVFFVLSITLSLAFLSIGAKENKQYIEGSVICDAVITDIKTEHANVDASYSYTYKYYGSYTVNGASYSDVEILIENAQTSTPTYAIGQICQIRVLQDNPAKLAKDGNFEYILAAVSFGVSILSGITGVYLYRHIKKSKNTAR